jgi:MATE family multidrug resistance protein
VLRRELRAILSLSLPVIVAELGWMFMGVIDTIMVSPLGPAAIGATSLGSSLFNAFGIFGIGLLLGLDTLVSQAWGAGRKQDCERSLWQGVYIAIGATPLLMLAVGAVMPAVRLAGVDPRVLPLAESYVGIVNLSMPVLLLYTAFRRYLQGMAVVRPVMFALVTANAVNAAGNYVLIPRFGVDGAAWATVASRTYMLLVLGGYALAKDSHLARPIRPYLPRIVALLGLGIPAGLQILLEIGVFAATAVLAGKLSAEALAAHTIVLNIAGTSFMVPLGISSAGAIIVGHAIGRADPAAARRGGWMAVGLGAGFMFAMAVVLVAAPGPLLRIFTRDAEVLALAASLTIVAAAFFVFDGVQVVTTGVLRGAGNTRTPMFANLMAHWLLGLPAGWILCFRLGLGVTGLWMGLSIGLIVVALVLVAVWHRTSLEPA